MRAALPAYPLYPVPLYRAGLTAGKPDSAILLLCCFRPAVDERKSPRKDGGFLGVGRRDRIRTNDPYHVKVVL